MMLPFLEKASVSDKTFRQEHVFQIFILSVSEGIKVSEIKLPLVFSNVSRGLVKWLSFLSCRINHVVLMS